MDSVEREEAAEKGRRAGVAIDGEARGGDLFEERVDVDQGRVGRLRLRRNHLIERSDLRLYGDDLRGGEHSGIGDRSLLRPAQDERNLRQPSGVYVIAGDDAQKTAQYGWGEVKSPGSTRRG